MSVGTCNLLVVLSCFRLYLPQQVIHRIRVILVLLNLYPKSAYYSSHTLILVLCAGTTSTRKPWPSNPTRWTCWTPSRPTSWATTWDAGCRSRYWRRDHYQIVAIRTLTYIVIHTETAVLATHTLADSNVHPARNLSLILAETRKEETALYIGRSSPNQWQNSEICLLITWQKQSSCTLTKTRPKHWQKRSLYTCRIGPIYDRNLPYTLAETALHVAELFCGL